MPLIIATIFAWLMFLLRNSNEGWGFFDLYEFDLSGGQVVIWSSDRSHHLKLDKPDLIVLVAATSVCLLAWMVFMRWRSAWRRRSKAAFPLQLSTKAVEPIALGPMGAIPLGVSGAIAANTGIVLAASPPVRRSKRIMLWLCVVSAAGVFLLILWSHTGAANSPETARLLLDADESKYLAAEGHQRRGRAFEAVVGRMAVVSLEGNRLTWPEVQQYLGPPGLYAGSPQQPSSVIYFYNRYGKKDWMVFIPFNSQGKTGDICFNATTANNLSGWTPYPTTSPTTIPATAKR